MIIPNIWENKKCSKPPTRYENLVFHGENDDLQSSHSQPSLSWQKSVVLEWASPHVVAMSRNMAWYIQRFYPTVKSFNKANNSILKDNRVLKGLLSINLKGASLCFFFFFRPFLTDSAYFSHCVRIDQKAGRPRVTWVVSDEFL